MTQHNPVNERIKRQYFTYLKEAKRYSAPSIDAAAAAIASFEAHTRCRDFKRFRIEQAVAFKRHLGSRASAASGAPLSKATQRRTLTALRSFFIWLADKPGYQSRIRYTDADYFNLSEKDARIATARRPKAFPSIEQVHATIAAMPAASVIDKRDRALLALTLLTGCRDGALASLKVKHIDLGANCLLLDAREVKTKFSKTFVTCFFPVGGNAHLIVADWMETLRSDLLWAPTDPLFPKTRMEAAHGEGFKTTGLERAHWSNASPIRRIFREAFERAGLPPFNPHSIRDTLIQLGQRVCHGPEEFKAWSQNIGHESVMTAFNSYGQVSAERQAEIIAGLSLKPAEPANLKQLLLRAADAVGREHTP
ncbi:MAG: tyrosine-type recombinase/integrase [Hyphomicrobiaceae bacterium]